MIHYLFTSIVQAHYKRKSYPTHLFLTYYTNEQDWWMKGKEERYSSNCSINDVTTILNNSLIINMFPTSTTRKTSSSRGLGNTQMVILVKLPKLFSKHVLN